MLRHLLSVMLLIAGPQPNAVAGDAQPDRKIDALAADCKAARTEYERRDICIRAIDSGIIHDGVQVQVLDRIFGTHLARDIRPCGFGIHVVPFAEQPVGPNDVQVPFVGWYLAFNLASNGQVLDYSLTNEHDK